MTVVLTVSYSTFFARTHARRRARKVNSAGCSDTTDICRFDAHNSQHALASSIASHRTIVLYYINYINYYNLSTAQRIACDCVIHVIWCIGPVRIDFSHDKLSLQFAFIDVTNSCESVILCLLHKLIGVILTKIYVVPMANTICGCPCNCM